MPRSLDDLCQAVDPEEPVIRTVSIPNPWATTQPGHRTIWLQRSAPKVYVRISDIHGSILSPPGDAIEFNNLDSLHRLKKRLDSAIQMLERETA